MFSATYFTYDGVFSGLYGLMIADFDDSSVIETNAFSPSLNTVKPPALNRFFHNGITYDEAPQHPFSIISEHPIQPSIRRKIISWLFGKDTYRVLKIYQPDLEGVFYKCVFTSIDIIYINGNCHGFRVTANFDSFYQYEFKEPILITGNGAEIVQEINNQSDINDNYIYPTVTFCTTAPVGDYDISIINKSDNPSRAFRFQGLLANETITVDNELKHISSSIGGERLSNFNKNWLRLKPGVNELSIVLNGTASIAYTSYALLGF